MTNNGYPHGQNYISVVAGTVPLNVGNFGVEDDC